MPADFDDNAVPDTRYANWVCKFCSEGFHNLASLEVHLNHSRCQDAHFADRGKAPWRRYEDGVGPESE